MQVCCAVHNCVIIKHSIVLYIVVGGWRLFVGWFGVVVFWLSFAGLRGWRSLEYVIVSVKVAYKRQRGGQWWQGGFLVQFLVGAHFVSGVCFLCVCR